MIRWISFTLGLRLAPKDFSLTSMLNFLVCSDVRLLGVTSEGMLLTGQSLPGIAGPGDSATAVQTSALPASAEGFVTILLSFF